MAKRKKDSPPNPNGSNGKPLRIPLAFDDALKAALETPPEPEKQPKRKPRTRRPRTAR